MPDAYGTDAGFLAYHAARNNDTSSIDPDDIEALLLRASEWIDGRYGASFSGTKVLQREQEREWPRYSATDRFGYAIDSTTVPREVENATYEAALIEGETPGSLVIDYTPSKYKRVSVDGAVSVEYASFGSGSDVQTSFGKVSMALADLLTAPGGAWSALSGAAVRV